MSLILEDEKFLSDLFGQLRDAKTSEDRRKELNDRLLESTNDAPKTILSRKSKDTRRVTFGECDGLLSCPDDSLR